MKAMLSTLVACAAAHAQPADLVIDNARIWSDGLDGFASFAAVRDGRFVHVGEEDASLIGPETDRLDAEGHVVIPGLIDSHVHMLNGGEGLDQVQLRDAMSKDEFIERVATWSRTLPIDAWVLGGRWSTESWDSDEQPTKDWVDDATGARPAFLSRMDGHSALANSAALKLAGITADGPVDPVGGVIDRHPVTNEPTGILRESAMVLVSRLIPPRAQEDQERALRRAMAHANAHGITGVCDIPGFGDLRVYERVAGDTSVRFYLYPTAGDWATAAARASDLDLVEHSVEMRGFKAYLDGSLGSRTAYMREPFLNNEPAREGWRGLFAAGVEDGRYKRNLQAIVVPGGQPITHAIGDEANHFLLDTLDAVYGMQLPQVRARSEHAQHLLPEDIGRFADLGVIASMQPYHKADDGRYAEEYIGEERCRSSYAFRSLLDAGAVLAFGSDWPVVSINPWLGIEAAVTGRTLDGKLWQTQQSISVTESLRAYTSTAAWSAFAEDDIGRIAPGYLADFVVLSHDPFEDGADLGSITALITYVGGEAVYSAPR